MQFLEFSFIGLRAARHVLTDPDGGRTITLFPMVHLGEAAFYDAVHHAAAQHEAVVIEGVASPVTRRLTRAYRWIAPGRLGLIVQPKFSTEATSIIPGDLTAAQFEALWRVAPWRERAVLESAATLVGLWRRITATRHNLGRGLCTSDLKDRDDILMWNERRAPLLQALIEARDRILCDTVTKILSEPSGPSSIAVIYGAGHMGALARSLDHKGFVVTKSDWLTVFET